jgi:RNA-binding protein YhbY
MIVDKKKDAKSIGQSLSTQTESELIQVLGHTILLYKRSNVIPSKAVTLALELELNKE